LSTAPPIVFIVSVVSLSSETVTRPTHDRPSVALGKAPQDVPTDVDYEANCLSGSGVPGHWSLRKGPANSATTLRRPTVKVASMLR